MNDTKKKYEPKHERDPNACPQGGVHDWKGTGHFPRQTEQLVCTKCGATGWD